MSRTRKILKRQINGTGYTPDVFIGQTGYLVEYEDLHQRHSTPRYRLYDTCPRTNKSHEERANGWLGTTDNVWYYAHGYRTVTAITRTHVHLTRTEPDA